MTDGSTRRIGPMTVRLNPAVRGTAISSRGSRLAFWSDTHRRWRLLVADTSGSAPRQVWVMPERTYRAVQGAWAPEPPAWSPDGRYLAICVPVGQLWLQEFVPATRLNPHMQNARTGIVDGLLRVDTVTARSRLWIRPDEDMADLGAASFQSVAWGRDCVYAVRAGDLWSIVPVDDLVWKPASQWWDWAAIRVRSGTGTIAGQTGDQWAEGYRTVFTSWDGRVVGACYGRINGGSGDEEVVLFRVESGSNGERLEEGRRLPDQRGATLSPDGRCLITVDMDDRAWLWRERRGEWRRDRLLAHGVDSAAFVSGRKEMPRHIMIRPHGLR